MTSKTLAAGLLVAGCVTAAAGGAYTAFRHNASDAPAPIAVVPADVQPVAQPVSDTEAIVSEPAAPAAVDSPPPAVEPAPLVTPPVVERPVTRPAPARKPSPQRDVRLASAQPEKQPQPAAAPAPPPAQTHAPDSGVPVAAPPVEAQAEPVRAVETAIEEAPAQEEIVLPASSVIGVQMETSLSSERSKVEDRVEARVTRGVTAAGRTAIPEGSRMIGAVTVVEPGGKLKERARLGIRFHTLVLANGREIPIRTEAIYREGDSPVGESSRKIGGAAVGGAILGAIIGGGKGAAIGGAAGGAAGTAAVMAGGRNAATLPAGTAVTVRLAAPATVEVDRRWN